MDIQEDQIITGDRLVSVFGFEQHARKVRTREWTEWTLKVSGRIIRVNGSERRWWWWVAFDCADPHWRSAIDGSISPQTEGHLKHFIERLKWRRQENADGK